MKIFDHFTKAWKRIRSRCYTDEQADQNYASAKRAWDRRFYDSWDGLHATFDDCIKAQHEVSDSIKNDPHGCR